MATADEIKRVLGHSQYLENILQRISGYKVGVDLTSYTGEDFVAVGSVANSLNSQTDSLKSGLAVNSSSRNAEPTAAAASSGRKSVFRNSFKTTKTKINSMKRPAVSLKRRGTEASTCTTSSGKTPKPRNNSKQVARDSSGIVKPLKNAKSGFAVNSSSRNAKPTAAAFSGRKSVFRNTPKTAKTKINSMKRPAVSLKRRGTEASTCTTSSGKTPKPRNNSKQVARVSPGIVEPTEQSQGVVNRPKRERIPPTRYFGSEWLTGGTRKNAKRSSNSGFATASASKQQTPTVAATQEANPSTSSGPDIMPRLSAKKRKILDKLLELVEPEKIVSHTNVLIGKRNVRHYEFKWGNSVLSEEETNLVKKWGDQVKLYAESFELQEDGKYSVTWHNTLEHCNRIIMKACKRQLNQYKKGLKAEKAEEKRVAREAWALVVAARKSAQTRPAQK